MQQRYLAQRPAVISTAPVDPTADFGVQFSKLAEALLTSKYIPTEAELLAAAEAAAISTSTSTTGKADPPMPQEKYQIAPRMLKALLGQGHPEFSTAQQQDASEYFMYLLQV